jgi:hypothetical protein
MFEKLAVYQKAVSFADAIAGLSDHFPRGFGFWADQPIRAATRNRVEAIASWDVSLSSMRHPLRAQRNWQLLL